MKYLVMTLLCLSLCASAFADQQTTLLTDYVEARGAAISLPYIDGSNDEALEKSANQLIRERAEKLAQSVGGGSVSYRVILNRPSLVSLMLEAENGGYTAMDGLNIDLTTGREFELSDFFVDSKELRAELGDYTALLFGEDGLHLRKSADDYNGFVPYRNILEHLRIGEAGRIFQVARLTKNAEGKTLVLDKPGLAALKLDSNPSTGYNWRLANAGSHVSMVGSSFTIPAFNDNRVGTPGVEIIFLAFDEPGTYDVVMEYKRSWERMQAQRFTFKVIVK